MTINKNIEKYIKAEILPQYEKNDSGHSLEHIDYVLKRCFKFSEQFQNINYNILYTIAAFHDIAHHIDKANHEKLSAEFFYYDEKMKEFFSEGERILIKEAIEDHRASSTYEPRSDYGKIISSADRSTDIDDFLRRTHTYTLKHFPNCTKQEMIERAYKHTDQKYGKSGYAKHYIKDEEYEIFRENINLLLSNKEDFAKKYCNLNNIK
ncbi:MAG: HD domain-containing protein [Ruminococcaceae bacterium]|nr:HD domain-containing protein [Oscillospiraceae bacterium]